MSAATMERSAILTECGRHRLELTRTWDDTLPVLTVVMVNPSDADAEVDDPTILTLCARAKFWGFGGIRVVNLYSLRSPDPKALRASPEPFHPDNGVTLEEAVEQAKIDGAWILVAWGNNCMAANDDGHAVKRFMEDCRDQDVELRCLGTTNAGHPKHPLARGVHRVPNDFKPIPFNHDYGITS